VYVGVKLQSAARSPISALDNIGGFVSPSSVSDAAARYRAALGEAAKYISLYWLGAMIGRFIGSALLQKVKAGKLLAIAAIMATLLVTTQCLRRPRSDVEYPVRWLIQLDHVPVIFTMGISRNWDAHG